MGWHWLMHFLGVDSTTGYAYAFWSGAGSDLGELAILGGMASAYRRHNCHVRRCWRLGLHPVDGTPYVVCRRHHPSGAPSASQVAGSHAAARDRAGAR